MLTLHGTWIVGSAGSRGGFLLWGEEAPPETWKKPRGRTPRIENHPYAVRENILKQLLLVMTEQLTVQLSDAHAGEAVIQLPSIQQIPLPARQTLLELGSNVVMRDWSVGSLWLSPGDALELLSAIPVDPYELPCAIGGDLRFWSVAAKFARHLIAEQNFVPTLLKQESQYLACWQSDVSGSNDAAVVEQLVQAMPDACRSVRSFGRSREQAATHKREPSPVHPRSLLEDFLNHSVDGWIRERTDARQRARLKRGVKDDVLVRWFEALTQPEGVVAIEGVERSFGELHEAFQTWKKGGKIATEKFRVCFRLEPPESHKMPWRLRYFLQAVDDPSLLVPVEAVWREQRATLSYLNRQWESPQERLLAGLGVASRMFPPIEQSLQQAMPEGCHLSQEEAYQFLSETSVLMQQSGFGVLAPPWWRDTRSRVRAKVRMESPRQESSGLFSRERLVKYNLELALGDETITPEELERLSKLKMPLIRMRGEWALLRPEDIQAALDAFEKYRGEGEISLREALQLSLSETKELGALSVESVECTGWMDSLFRDVRNQRLRRLQQPKAFVGTLRPYQLYGFSWLSFMRKWGLGACLADDMGLGKTIQVIALLLRERKRGKSKSRPNLLVCPTSVVGNWQREMLRFSPTLETLVHHGSERKTDDAFVEAVQKVDLVITSYGLLQRDVKPLTRGSWKGLFLDEAQNIKNPSSKTAQSARKLQAEYRFALTGTPIENRLSELWSLMEFLNPGYLGSQKGFQGSFSRPIERYGDELATRQLQSLVSPFILRRLKTDPKVIKDLPEKLEMKVYCHLTREQVTLYEALVQDMLGDVEEAEEMRRRGMILAGLMKLKQLCNHPALLLHDPSQIQGRSGKLQRLVEMLEEVLAEGDKALVFTQFREMGDLLQRCLFETFHREVIFLHGGVAQKQRQRMVSLFQESRDGPPIFIISIRAGGTGLNLTRANHVFHFDRWWNPAVEDQATDRAFRIGQTRNVQVRKFITAGTLEERIDELIERKKALSESVIGTGEDWITELSTDEFRQLVRFRPEAAVSEE